MIEKTLQMALLFDAYGSVLTSRQREFFSLYYNDDLSLGEIAHNYQVSRQAVYDILRRSESTLSQLEQKLGLVKRKQHLQDESDQMLAALQVLEMAVAQAPAGIQETAKVALTTLQAYLQSTTEDT